MATPLVTLRPIVPSDLDTLFEIEADPLARWMAAFGPPASEDRVAFDGRWRRVLADPAVIISAVMVGPELVGDVVSYESDGRRELGYWIAQPFWGRGIASAAVHAFLREHETRRPVYARAVDDHVASLRVLAKNGFTRERVETSFSDVRGGLVREVVCVLR